MTWIAIAIGAAFALNIGASGTAAAMGAAYGGRAITKQKAQLLAGLFALLGSVVGGGAVVVRIGHGIVPDGSITVTGAIVVLAAACATLALANYIRIPLSTSEVTVGAVVGLGLAVGTFSVPTVLFIVSAWIVFPLLVGGLSWLCGRYIHNPLNRWFQRSKARRWGSRLLAFGLVGGGCFEAFAAGTNNVANALGPLVGAGILDTHVGLWLGGLAVGVGAASIGGRVLETNGRLTRLTLLGGAFVSLIAGSLTLIASMFGIPVPLTQGTTAAIAGLGAGSGGTRSIDMTLVKRIGTVWVTSPVTSLMFAYIAMLIPSTRTPGIELPVILLIGGVTTAFLFRQAKMGQLHGQNKPAADAHTSRGTAA